MNELTIYNNLIIAWFVIAAAVFIALFFYIAPYGRYIRKGFGPTINDKLAWVGLPGNSQKCVAYCSRDELFLQSGKRLS